MNLNMTMDIDNEIIEDVERVINNGEFAQYLLSHTVYFESAGLILQTLLDTVEDIKKKLNN